MIRALLSLCGLLAVVLPLAAQSGPEGARGRSAWFACTSLPDDLENPVKIRSGEEIFDLELPRFMASKPVKIPEGGVIQIVRPVPDPEDPETMRYLVLAHAKIPDGVREALIILIPLPEPDGDLLFQAGVRDLAGFKGGDRLFINLSETDIGVKIGENKIPVPAKRSEIFRAPNLVAPRNAPIMYSFFHPERQEWKIISASTVVLRPTRREITVFNEGSRIGNIKKHKILFPVVKEG